MSDISKMVLDWEQEAGLIIHDISDTDLHKIMTREEFDALVQNYKISGVNHEDRRKWLISKQHPLTRENLTNHQLE